MGAYSFRVVAGAADGLEVPLGEELLIGRSETGAGNLGGDQRISRRHARVYRAESGALVIEDLGSSNGTHVNGRRIQAPHVIRPGDRISVGDTTLELLGGETADDESARSAPAPGAAAAPLAAPGSPKEAAATPAAGATPAGGAPPGGGATPHFAGAAGSPLTSGSRGGARFILPLVIAVLLGVAVAAYFVGHGNSKTVTANASAATSDLPPGHGVVYIESNIARHDGNSVLAFQYGPKGDLRPLHITEYPTGGSGAADLTDSGVLDADQHLWMDTPKHLLFAVNQGSDTVAVFHVAANGALSPVKGSPFPSGGKAPASVGVSGDVAIVTNKAQDGIRDLTNVSPTYATFHIASDGALTQFGPTITAPPGNSPTDAMVGPNGRFVMSTEEGGPFRAFELTSDGLKQGSNSPLQPDPSIFPANFDASEKWGLGLSASPRANLVYIGMATVNKIAVYRYDDTAKLTFVRVVDAPGAELPCWTLVNKAGTRLYTANAGNNTMSVFDISDPTDPKPIQLLHLHGNGNPWDMRFDPTGKMIFLVDPRARMNVPPGQGQGVHTLLIGADGKLTEPNYSGVPIPDALDVNPYGMAVLGGT
jgi:6-phosphogluconolactonase (cycloisomerase 2 family)